MMAQLGSALLLATAKACLCLMLDGGRASAWGATPVMVQDYGQASAPPTVWAVNIPNERASVRRSTDQLNGGQHCLRLHYRFVSNASFQYLGIPNKDRIQAPVSALRFWLKGMIQSAPLGSK